MLEVTTWLMFLSSSHYRLCSSLHYWPTMITLSPMFLLNADYACLLLALLPLYYNYIYCFTCILWSMFCIALLAYCYCSACILWSMFYIALPSLLVFFYLCSTLLCLPSTFQCSTSLCLSLFQLTLVTPFTSCTLYHLPWSSGEPSLKTQRATS